MSDIIQEVYNEPITCCGDKARREFEDWFDKWREDHPNRRIVCVEHPIMGPGEEPTSLKVTISYRESEV